MGAGGGGAVATGGGGVGNGVRDCWVAEGNRGGLKLLIGAH